MSISKINDPQNPIGSQQVNPTENEAQPPTPGVVAKLIKTQNEKGVLDALVDGKYYDVTSYDNLPVTAKATEKPDPEPHSDKHTDKAHSDVEPPEKPHTDRPAPHSDHTDNTKESKA